VRDEEIAKLDCHEIAVAWPHEISGIVMHRRRMALQVGKDKIRVRGSFFYSPLRE